MKKILLPFFAFIFSFHSFSQSILNPYQHEMDVAYQMYPDVPKGILEGWSFTMTHFTHLDETIQTSCFGLPKAYTVMGLTENGQGYFLQT